MLDEQRAACTLPAPSTTKVGYLHICTVWVWCGNVFQSKVLWCDERRPANVNIAATVILKLNLRAIGEAAARQKPTLAGWWQRQWHYLLKSRNSDPSGNMCNRRRYVTCTVNNGGGSADWRLKFHCVFWIVKSTPPCVPLARRNWMKNTHTLRWVAENSAYAASSVKRVRALPRDFWIWLERLEPGGWSGKSGLRSYFSCDSPSYCFLREACAWRWPATTRSHPVRGWVWRGWRRRHPSLQTCWGGQRVGEGNGVPVFLFNESVVSRSEEGVDSAGLALGHGRATCT